MTRDEALNKFDREWWQIQKHGDVAYYMLAVNIINEIYDSIESKPQSKNLIEEHD